jgi:signal peptidase
MTTTLRRLAAAIALVVPIAMGCAAVAWTVAVRSDCVRSARILTGSMTPGVPEGSLVVGTPSSPEKLRVGQIIMFRPPAPYGEPGDVPVVHRVVAVSRHGTEIAVRTKGDANRLPDPWIFDAQNTTVYQVRVAWPGVGRLVEVAGRSSGQTLLALPVLFTTPWLLRSIWRRRSAESPPTQPQE